MNEIIIPLWLFGLSVGLNIGFIINDIIHGKKIKKSKKEFEYLLKNIREIHSRLYPDDLMWVPKKAANE